MLSHYNVLQITDTANKDQIHAAYIKLAMQFHPDKNSSTEASAEFLAINNAYKTLSNPDLRCRYDKEIAKKVTGMAFKLVANNEETANNNNSSSALTVMNSYNFREVATLAGLSSHELFDLARKSSEFALETIASEALREELGTYYVLELGKTYLPIALKIIQTPKLYSWFNNHYIMALAIKHWQVCEILFKQESFQKDINITDLKQLIKEHGDKSLKLCRETPSLAEKYHAYQDLNSYKKDKNKKVDNIEKYKSQLTLTQLGTDKIKEICSKNIFVHSVINDDPNLRHILDSSSSSSSSITTEKPAKPISVSEYAVKSLKNCLEVLNDPRKAGDINRSTLYTVALEYKAAALNIISNDSISVSWNGFELYTFGQCHGEEILKSYALKPHLQIRYKAYLVLEQYQKKAQHDQSLFSYFKMSQIPLTHLAILLAKNKELALSWVQDELANPSLNAIISPILAFEEVANLIFNDSQKWPFLSGFGAHQVSKKFKQPCIKFLSSRRAELILSGSNLLDLVEKHGNDALDAIMKNSVLHDRLCAYKLIIQAKKGDLTLTQEISVETSEHTAEQLYQMGLSFLKSKSFDKNKIAATYFYKAALKNNERAFDALMKLQIHIDKEYLFNIAELFNDASKNVFNKQQAKIYYQKSASAGDKRAIPKLQEFLLNEIGNASEEKSLDQNQNYLLINNIIQNQSLITSEKDQMLRFLITASSKIGNLSKELYHSKQLSLVSSEELYHIAHLILADIESQQKATISQQNPHFNDNELSIALNQPEKIAERLNQGLPKLIEFANLCQDEDMKNQTIIPLLNQLAETGAISAEVTTLILQDFRLAKSIKKPLFFAICNTYPAILADTNSSLVAVQCIDEGEILYQLAWKCTKKASGKFDVSAYLFWYGAACKGHIPAINLMKYFSKPMPSLKNHDIISILAKNNKAADGSLEEDESGQFLNDNAYQQITNMLNYYLMHKNKNTINLSALHAYAFAGDEENLVAHADQYSFLDVDCKNRNVLQVLHSLHPEMLVNIYARLKNNMKKLYKYSQALPFLIADLNNVDNDIVALLNEITPPTNHLTSNNHLLTGALTKCVQKDNLFAADFLLDQINPLCRIDLIKLVTNKFISSVRFSMHNQTITYNMKMLFEEKITATQNKWDLFLDKMHSNLSSSLKPRFFYNDSFKAKIIFLQNLVEMKNYPPQNIVLQLRRCLQNYIDLLLVKNDKKELMEINNLLGTHISHHDQNIDLEAVILNNTFNSPPRTSHNQII
jgi:hypothetical protein